MFGWVVGWMDGQMNRWRDGCRCMFGWVVGWMNRWMDGQYGILHSTITYPHILQNAGKCDLNIN